MDAFADANDIAAVWRPLTTSEAAIADALLEQASNLLRVKVANIDAAITADGSGLKGDLAKSAVVNAVKRVFLNPDGLLQEQIDDYQWRRDSAISSGSLYIDPADLGGLRGVSGGWGSIRLKAGLG